MRCNTCVHGGVSYSGKVLTCFSSRCPVPLSDAGMVFIEDVSKYRLDNCKAYKKEVFLATNDSFSVDIQSMRDK